MAKNGRPTKYKPEYCKQAYKFCLLKETTDKQLAVLFDVDEATINRWKESYPKFCKSIKAGKEIADAQVAKSLFERACGYSHKEDKIFNDGGTPLIVPTIKHYPPDTAAAFIWLKNRAGWRDKTETEHKISEETATLLGLIDGSSKGILPGKGEKDNGTI